MNKKLFLGSTIVFTFVILFFLLNQDISNIDAVIPFTNEQQELQKLQMDLNQKSYSLNTNEINSNISQITELKNTEIFEHSWNASIIPSEITAEAGGLLELHLVVENQENTSLKIANIGVNYPTGWNIQENFQSVTLSGEESIVIPLKIQIPEDVKFGNYPILIKVETIFQTQTKSTTIKVPEPELKPKLFASVKKIKLVQYIGEDPKVTPFMNFLLYNSNNVPVENLSTFATELVNKDEIRYVGFTPDSKYHDFKVRKQTPLDPTKPIRFNYELAKPILKEGTYEGQLHIVGDNFDTISIDVEVDAKYSPWNLLLFTFLGIASSLGLSVYVIYREKSTKHKETVNDDDEIIEHVNMHIIEWNYLRKNVTKGFWENLSNIFNNKKQAIETLRDKIKLNKSDDAVKWFEDIESTLHLHILTDKSNPTLPIDYKDKHSDEQDNPSLPILYKPKYSDYLSEDHISQKIKEEYTSNGYDESCVILSGNKNEVNIDRQVKDAIQKMKSSRDKEEKGLWEMIKNTISAYKVLYLATILVVSVPTSIFLGDNFISLEIINYLIAFGAGFAIYKIQDIRNAFKQK